MSAELYFNINSKPPTKPEIARRIAYLNDSIVIANRENRVFGKKLLCICMPIAIAICIVAPMLGVELEKKSAVTVLIVFIICLFQGILVLLASLALYGKWCAFDDDNVNYAKLFCVYFMPAVLGVVTACSLTYVSWYQTLFDIVGSLMAAFIFGFAAGYIYSITRFDREDKAVGELDKMVECQDRQILEMSEWMVCPDVREYVDKVIQDERLVNLHEFDLLKSAYQDWKKRTDLEAAMCNVYGKR